MLEQPFRIATITRCNYSASYDNFSILTCEKKIFLLELKESLLIMGDEPSQENSMLSGIYPSSFTNVRF